MIGKGVRERSQRRRRENILFLTPLSLFSDLTLFQLLCGCIHCLRHRQNQTSSILSVKQDQNCCSGPLPVYQDNLFFYEVQTMIGLFKKPYVKLPLIRWEGNSKHISSNLLSPLGSQNKDLIGVASQTLLIA